MVVLRSWFLVPLVSTQNHHHCPKKLHVSGMHWVDRTFSLSGFVCSSEGNPWREERGVGKLNFPINSSVSDRLLPKFFGGLQRSSAAFVTKDNGGWREECRGYAQSRDGWNVAGCEQRNHEVCQPNRV